MRLSLKPILKWLKCTFKRLMHLRASPHEIALGMAIGIFIGIFPTFGFGGLIVLGIAPLLKFNVPAAFIGGTILSNPLTAPLWIYLSCRIVGIDFEMLKTSGESLSILFNHFTSIAGMYVAGNSIISTITSVIFYGLTFTLISSYRKNCKKKSGGYIL